MTTNFPRVQINLREEDIELIKNIVSTFGYSFDVIDFSFASVLVLNKKNSLCKVDSGELVEENVLSSGDILAVMQWLVSTYEPSEKSVMGDSVIATIEDNTVFFTKPSMTKEEFLKVAEDLFKDDLTANKK